MPFRGIVTKTLLESNCGKLFLTMGKFPFEYWFSARLKLEIVVLKFLITESFYFQPLSRMAVVMVDK